MPLNSLVGDFYSFRDTDRTICGARTGHCFAIGQKVEVLLDRIDREQRRLQFALLPGTEPKASSLRAPSKKRVEEDRPAKTSKNAAEKRRHVSATRRPRAGGKNADTGSDSSQAVCCSVFCLLPVSWAGSIFRTPACPMS